MINLYTHVTTIMIKIEVISFTLKSSLMLLCSHSSLLPYHHWSQVAFCHYNLVSYFLEFYVSGIVQYSLSHVWLILLSMFFRFVYVIASVSSFFLLLVFHWLDIPPFTHSPLDVDLYCFWILASMSTKSWGSFFSPAWLVGKTFIHWISLAPVLMIYSCVTDESRPYCLKTTVIIYCPSLSKD